MADESGATIHARAHTRMRIRIRICIHERSRYDDRRGGGYDRRDRSRSRGNYFLLGD